VGGAQHVDETAGSGVHRPLVAATRRAHGRTTSEPYRVRRASPAETRGTCDRHPSPIERRSCRADQVSAGNTTTVPIMPASGVPWIVQ
jgi:hypothetical protein